MVDVGRKRRIYTSFIIRRQLFETKQPISAILEHVQGKERRTSILLSFGLLMHVVAQLS